MFLMFASEFVCSVISVSGERWYNKQLGVLDIVNRIHALCPEGFIQSADMAAPAKKEFL